MIARRRIIECLVIGIGLALVTACGDAPKTLEGSSDQFVVIGSVVNQAANSISVSIRVSPPATREHVKAVAEQAISRYRDQYRNVTIRSFIAGSSPSELPFATSILENGVVTHQFNPNAATRKIPTH
ncbi:MAG TPA: hypothetical protein VNO14_07630 [Blastocatellia bacterium]|nr:hypothetical protein [Blastocatellia bacterium]